MPDRWYTEIARLRIVGIEHQLLQNNFRIYHINLERMQSRLVHPEFCRQPTQVVEHFVAAESIPVDELQRPVTRRQRFEIR